MPFVNMSWQRSYWFRVPFTKQLKPIKTGLSRSRGGDSKQCMDYNYAKITFTLLSFNSTLLLVHVQGNKKIQRKTNSRDNYSKH